MSRQGGLAFGNLRILRSYRASRSRPGLGTGRAGRYPQTRLLPSSGFRIPEFRRIGNSPCGLAQRAGNYSISSLYLRSCFRVPNDGTRNSEIICVYPRTNLRPKRKFLYYLIKDCSYFIQPIPFSLRVLIPSLGGANPTRSIS